MKQADGQPDRGQELDPKPDLRSLLVHHLPQLEAYVRRNLARSLQGRESVSDLLHSVCGDLLEDTSGFEYRGDAQFQNYLRVVVLNKLRSKLRQQRAQKRGGDLQALSDSHLDATPGAAHSPSQFAMLREEFALFERALAKLPEHYREVIVRTRIRGEPRQQVARDLGRTLPSLRNLLNRALVKLAGEMDRLQHSHHEPADDR